jgi:transposase
MKILAIDLGKFKSVFVCYEGKSLPPRFGKLETSPQAFHDLLLDQTPDRLVIEVGPSAGWVCDLAQALQIPIQVANGNDERWNWKRTKRKTDRDDALKLAQLSEMDCLPVVHVPQTKVRQWRSLITYRHGLVDRRTMIKNSIRSCFERQGLKLAGGEKAWSTAGLEQITLEARSAAEVSDEQLWRFQLHSELQLLKGLQGQIGEVEEKLAELAAADERVKRLQTAPYVGPRLSELVVAVLDDPQRFDTAAEVGSYAGLTPRRWQSGQMDRQGHISHAGNRLLRKLLIEIGWLGVRGSCWMKQVYDNICRGCEKRKKIAIVAVARRLLMKLWAMLRDGTVWKDDLATAAA